MERKTKTKNKINKKKWLQENKQGKKRKRASAHSIGVTKMKLLKKKKVDDREEQKHHKNTRGKWTRKQFKEEEKKTHKTQKTHRKRC